MGRDTLPSAGGLAGRRTFLRRLAGVSLVAAAVPLAGCQGLAAPAPAAPKFRRIGYFDPGYPGTRSAEIRAFQDQLRELGYVEGQSIRIEYGYGYDTSSRLPIVAADLAGRDLEAIVAFGTQAIEKARDATQASALPIIMASSSDPVGSGLVESLARPGGRITGLTSNAPELTGKRLQLLREAVPTIARVGYFWDSTNAGDSAEQRRLVAAAQTLGIELVSLDVQGNPQNFRLLQARAVDERAEGLVTFASSIINSNPRPIVELAATLALPAIYAQRDFVTDHGGLLAYGPSYPDMYRRAAVFVDKVLRGARPAQLPVEKARQFKLVVNRQAVQALGLAIPRALLVQVDEAV